MVSKTLKRRTSYGAVLSEINSDTWFWTYGDVHGERFHFVFHGDEHQPGVTKEGDIYAAAIQ
ncbi:MAG: hypothetical protein ACRD1R_08285, partial [Acidobacteriota bacterium]